MRNEFSTGIPVGAELYLGIDYGEVGGPTADLLIGRRLAGAALGVRGAVRQLHYDIFVGTPLKKPGGFVAANFTGGPSLSLNF
jgi:hemolysin activation/secretion protein